MNLEAKKTRLQKDPYKQFEKGDMVEVLVENEYGEMIAHIQYRNGYAKSKKIEEASVKVRQKKEGCRKERLI